ncbi:hypothetical protein ONZ45_g13108 [Pleurotus djamor]|nr:hypothetical protein ONZ45_g13108 [Pleurotus djamor]
MSVTEDTYLCIDVSRQTWNEFYTLDEVYCRNLLQLLQPTTTVESVSSLEEPSETQADTYININDALQVIEIPDFHDFRPTPAYESCLPLDINRHIGDDPEDMGYFPFADDPSFDLKRYAHEYKYDFAWMSDSNLDPELELLVLEAARRLHINHGLSIAQIDDTGILVHALQPTQPQYAKFGMLLKATQRDYPEFQPQLNPFTFSDYFDSKDVTPRATFRNQLSFLRNLVVRYSAIGGSKSVMNMFIQKSRRNVVRQLRLYLDGKRIHSIRKKLSVLTKGPAPRVVHVLIPA